MSGIRSYNHQGLAQKPEYQQARKAIDDLLRSLPQGPALEYCLGLVSDIVRTNVGDRCAICREAGFAITLPFAVAVVSPSEAVASYFCARCGNEWEAAWPLPRIASKRPADLPHQTTKQEQ